jgi:hypothetical protein
MILQWCVLDPMKALEEERIGCTAQCPFCGAVCAGGVACQNPELRSQKHRAEIHMPRVCITDKSQLSTEILIRNALVLRIKKQGTSLFLEFPKLSKAETVCFRFLQSSAKFFKYQTIFFFNIKIFFRE